MKQSSKSKLQSVLPAEERDRVQLDLDGLQAELDRMLNAVADVNDEDIDKTSQLIASATLRRDRAAARLETIEAQLAEAEKLEAAAGRVALRREADAGAERAAIEVEKLHAEISKLARRMIEVAAIVDQKVEAFNASAKDEGEPVWSVGARIAQKFYRPHQVLSEEIVSRWVYSRTGERIPDDKQLAVRVKPEKSNEGILPSVGLGGPQEAVLRKFRVVKFLPAQRAWAIPMATTINIPALVDGGVPGWRPVDHYFPASVPAKLQELAELDAQPDRRQPKIEIVEVEVGDIAAKSTGSSAYRSLVYTKDIF